MTTVTAVRAKVCSTCRIEKPAHEFNTANSRTDGLTPRCRDCNKAASRAYRQAMKPEHDKTCARCGYGMPYSAFPRNPLRPDGHGEWCRTCHEREARRTRIAITLRRMRRAQELAAAEAEKRRNAYDPTEVGAAWQKRAACRDAGGDQFYDIGRGTDAAPRVAALREQYCDHCPVAQYCQEDGARIRYGVWGGLNREPKAKPA